jgi:hypothetical protein
MAFTNSFSQPNTQPPKGGSAAAASGTGGNAYGDQPMSAASMSAPQGAIQPAAASAASSEAPGFGLVDGLMSLVLAPGRAIIGSIQEPTMRDLPLVIGISAAFWWASWWAFNKYYLQAPEGATPVVKVKRVKRVKEVEEEDED